MLGVERGAAGRSGRGTDIRGGTRQVGRRVRQPMLVVDPDAAVEADPRFDGIVERRVRYEAENARKAAAGRPWVP